MSRAQVAVVDAMLVVDPVTRRSDFDRLKTSAPAATVQRLKNHVAHLTWLDSLGPTEAWLQGVPPAKVSHFAGEARVTDASDLRRYGDGKRRALVIALLHQARVRARDEIARCSASGWARSTSGPGNAWRSCGRPTGPSRSGC
jgi:hypothetical protein